MDLGNSKQRVGIEKKEKSSIVYLAFNNKNKSQFRTEWSAIQSTIKNFGNHSCVRWYNNSQVLG